MYVYVYTHKHTHTQYKSLIWVISWNELNEWIENVHIYLNKIRYAMYTAIGCTYWARKRPPAFIMSWAQAR